MNDATKAEAADYLDITIEQFEWLASGRLVLWQDKAVRRDEREACAKIADEAGAWCRSFSSEETADTIRDKIRARGKA